MNIDDYSKHMNENVNRVLKSNINHIVDITIKNYAIYNTYFVKLQDKLSNHGKKLDIKLNSLNFFSMYSTFMFNFFINDLISNNYFSAKINLRVITEFYFKYLFLLYNDNYVYEMYLDFNDIYLYNLAKKINKFLRMTESEKIQLEENYEKTMRKYNMKGNIKEDYRIKLAIEHNTGKKSTKSI